MRSSTKHTVNSKNLRTLVFGSKGLVGYLWKFIGEGALPQCRFTGSGKHALCMLLDAPLKEIEQKPPFGDIFRHCVKILQCLSVMQKILQLQK